MIAVVDYGMGNLRSVLNALEHVGAEATLATAADQVAAAEKVVLPGVGAFGDGMRNLAQRGLATAVQAFATAGRPLLGICLGMQLLASRGTEFGDHEGLGLIPGTVDPLDTDQSLRVPHVGWNAVTPLSASRLLVGLPSEPIFYFAHSYHLIPENPSTVTGTTDYGKPLTASIERGYLFGVQFHPEKSQRDGLKLLENFVGL
jgi:glutamine amidotransferase